jgi:Putative esterase
MKPSFVSLLCAAIIATETLSAAQSPPPGTPSPDSQYRLGPDSMPQDGVPVGEIRGSFTLPSKVYPGTQHTYRVYVPAQYDPAIPASLMVFNDGQAFKNPDGDMRAQNVMDNLIYRREIPVMLAVFINPGRTPEQPEPTPQEWGDHTTNRPTEYNTPDDKYARVITEELMPALVKGYNFSKDPDQRGIGGFEFRRDCGIHGRMGTAKPIPQGVEQRGQLRQSARRRCLSGARAGHRKEADPDLSMRWA